MSAQLSTPRRVTRRPVGDWVRDQEQLASWQRFASMGKVAAIVHEIDNPLTAILGNLEFATSRIEDLAQRVPVETPLREALLDAREAAEQLRRITKDFKRGSTPHSSEREPVDVRSALESAVRMASHEIRNRARLIHEYSRTPIVLASESRLRQVLLNLLLNAAQAIPKGNVDANEIRVATWVDSTGHVVVSIADTGSGIRPEVQRRLFMPFCTTKPPGVGTGLGLAICHWVIASFDGEILFTSEVGKGTEFRVVLPPAHPGPEA
jgi:signal transduction histidine kinase